MTRARRVPAPRPGAIVSAAVCLLLSACTVGPDYQRPQVQTPPAWHTDGYWRLAQPSHAPLAPDWWRSFGDKELDGLEQQAIAGNIAHAAKLSSVDASLKSRNRGRALLSQSLGDEAHQRMTEWFESTSYVEEYEGLDRAVEAVLLRERRGVRGL